ncbi:MAG: GerAB/ArcD/ProY family transporter, partial [Clostridia bacterium]|nr:GerAB/ArcD/ProY family transporter [Clostridia bacterium]
MVVTSKQFYIMLFITTISLKVQKLPSIIYDKLGKDGYLILLLYFAVDMALITLAFFVLKTLKNRPLMPQNKNTLVMLTSKLLVLAIVVYFVIQGLLLYESIQNLFEHILFDNLSWVVFSLLLLFTIFFLASSGITNIARNFELYFVVIIISYLLISIFGASKADFSAILPLDTINAKLIVSKFVDFNLWFGDFFLVLFMGRHAKEIKLKWTMLIYSLTIVFILFLYVELNGIYGDYTAMKPSLITTITEQSMLGVGIGRVDWFLILITEIGTILSCGTCIFFSKQCLGYIFP